MPAKKEESHDCKAECAELHKQLAALKKEVAALKKDLKAKSSGSADPRVGLLIDYIKLIEIEGKRNIAVIKNNEKLKEILKSL